MLLLLLAEAGAAVAGVTLTDVTPIISSIGSLGFAIWFAYYTATTLIPNQQKEHRDQIEKITNTHANTIEKSAAYHSSMVDKIVGEMKAARDSFERWRSGGGHA